MDLSSEVEMQEEQTTVNEIISSEAKLCHNKRRVRCRGRLLLGLDVLVTSGRYKGECGSVISGAHGYYAVHFHRQIKELKSYKNMLYQRSAVLVPINETGDIIPLPLSPDQRRVLQNQSRKRKLTNSSCMHVKTRPRLNNCTLVTSVLLPTTTTTTTTSDSNKEVDIDVASTLLSIFTTTKS